MFGRSAYTFTNQEQSSKQTDNNQEENMKSVSAMATSTEKEREGALTAWTPEWSTESVDLKDFQAKNFVPNFVKVTKGQYMNISQSRFSLQKSHNQLYIHSFESCIKVLSHSVQRVTENQPTGPYKQRISNKKLLALQQRLAIPIGYEGWFEILSEDGRGSRPIETVQELAKVFPEKCLVRQDIVAYGTNEDGKLSSNVTKLVQVGEQLLLSGDITTSVQSRNHKIKLLRCINNKSENIYLPFEKRGIFSPIYSEDMYTGVLQIRDIIQKYRMPLTVKLVHGIWPKVEKERFTGLIRLDWVYVDDTVFMCPFEKDIIRMIPVPLDSSLQLAPSTNFKALTEKESYKKLHSKCSRMVSNYNNTIHLIVNVPNAVARCLNNKVSRNMFSQTAQPESNAKSISKTKEKRLMDEIDDIYQFVRDGGVAPKSKFTYDSDEESFWEEPAYEPLDNFQQCLKAIESGKQVQYHKKYQPADAAKLGLGRKQNAGNIRKSQRSYVSTAANSKSKEKQKQVVEQRNLTQIKPETDRATNNQNLTKSCNNVSDLPLGSNSKDSGKTSHSAETPLPPPIPPRHYKRSGSFPLLDTAPVLKLIQASSDQHLMQSSKSNNTSQGSSATSSANSSKKFSKKLALEESAHFIKHLNKRRQTMFL
ncbi:uncharacterized protein LOC115214529 [Octopus sinensis]|uniref:Uncharacterized protein LOC115214529 n=1 Tax=Octopus sinensis TaxID=2607531 RepID=A0A6P7SMS5_9MOLL|nr:uncharacterized protein LOC115214529 [Octopus sinensis]